MSIVDVDVQSPDYKNWVKAGICLNYTKQGLVEFADIESKILHEKVIVNVMRSGVPGTGTPVCNVRVTGNRLRNTCGHPYCQSFLNAVIQEGISPSHPFRINHVQLRNTDVKKWHCKPWELAKLFMNAGQLPTQTCPEETELGGILNFLRHCRVPLSDITNIHYVQQVLEARNMIFHSAIMMIKESDLMACTEGMVNLLKDPKISRSRNAVNAVVAIQRVIQVDVVISVGHPTELTYQIPGDLIIRQEMVPAQDNCPKEKAEVESDPDSLKLPAEILRMDNRSIELYRKALEDGMYKDYSVRIMVTGPFGVGKSTFTKRLMYQDVDIKERHSTDGIDVHVNKCKVPLQTTETSEWIVDDTDSRLDNTVQRLANFLKNSNLNDKEETRRQDELDVQSRTVDNAEQKSDKLKSPDMSEDKTEGGNVIYVRDSDLEVVEKNNRLKHELIMRDLKEVIADASKKGGQSDYADISIWDFGGQFVFYSTHQMFLSPRAIYILIINLSQHISDDLKDDKPYCDCSRDESSKIEDYIDIWLNSIHGQSKSGQPKLPPVILVGTHADKLKPETREIETDAIFREIRKRLAGTDVSLHFIDKDFGLNNYTVDPELVELRRTIMHVATNQPYWGEEKPAKWIPLEKVLAELRRNGVEIIRRSEIEQLNENLAVPITEEELELFLQFQHQLANIMYFSVPELNNTIVLRPQFLVDALKSLITSEMFCRYIPEIFDDWLEFEQNGILKTSLLDAIWNRDENHKFRDNRAAILALMEHLFIITRPLLYIEDEEAGIDANADENDKYYLAPCMLREAAPSSVFHCQEKFISTPCLCLILENFAFPSAIFNRLLVQCIARWPIATSRKKYHIYCGCGQFDVDLHHRLTLSFHSNIIGLRITRYGKAETDPDVSICKEVYTSVKQSLKRINECLSLAVEFDEHVQCSYRGDNDMACTHSVMDLMKHKEIPCHKHAEPFIVQSFDLLKYWFDAEGTENDITEAASPWALEQEDFKITEQVYKPVLNRCRELLVKKMQFEFMHDFLKTKEILSDIKMRDIKEEKNTSSRIRELTDAVAKIGPRGYTWFCEGLKSTGQRELYYKVKKMEEKVLKEKSKDSTPDPATSLGATDQQDLTSIVRPNDSYVAEPEHVNTPITEEHINQEASRETDNQEVRPKATYTY